METDQVVYEQPDESEAKPKPRRWRPAAIAFCAVLGAFYGATLGSAISTTPAAAGVIAAAAGITALLIGVLGARLGLFIGMLYLGERGRSEKAIVARHRLGRLFIGLFAVIGGAVLGGFFGVMAVTPLGVVILGAVAGWFFMQAVLWRYVVRRFLGGLSGVPLGACAGAIVLALQTDQPAALAGIAWGAGIGAVAGMLLFLSFMGATQLLRRQLRRQAEDRRSERKNYIDATFQE